MKQFIWCAINTALMFLMFVYLVITKDINTQALDKVDVLEEKINNQQEIINFLIDIQNTKRDTIIVNVNYVKK